MSFILEALRKSELERQRLGGPSIAELPIARVDRRLPVALVAIGLLLAVNAAVFAYFLLREDSAPAAAEPAAVVAASPVTTAPINAAPEAARSPRAPQEYSLAAEAADSFELPESPASRPPEAPDPTLLPEPEMSPGSVRYAPAPPPVDALPPQATAGLAELTVDLHIYSEDPAKRAVFVNGRRYTEGMALAEGPMVEEITRDGVVVNHRGQRFLLPRH